MEALKDSIDDQPSVVKTTRQVKRELEKHFTNSELLEMGKELAHTMNEIRQLVNEKKATNSHLAAGIENKIAEAQSMSSRINSGYEIIPVDCTITMDDPTPGTKTIRRNDSLEIVTTEQMNLFDNQAPDETESENQPEINLFNSPQNDELEESTIVITMKTPSEEEQTENSANDNLALKKFDESIAAAKKKFIKEPKAVRPRNPLKKRD